MTLINWAFCLRTTRERAFATVALGHAMEFGRAQRMGESQGGSVRLGGAPVMLAAMRELVAGLWKVVEA